MKIFETFSKLGNKWIFNGWYPMLNEEYCISTNRRGKYLYKTYIFPGGSLEELRYGSCLEK